MGNDQNEPIVGTAASRPVQPPSRSTLATVLAAAAVLAALSLLFTSAASAEEDGEPYVSAGQGELTFEASALAPGATVTISGTGFASDSSVILVMSVLDVRVPIVREGLSSDSEGAVSYSFTLPSEMVTAEYLARLTGVTADGGTLRLETVVQIAGNIEQPAAPITAAAGEPAPDPEPQVLVPLPVEGGGVRAPASADFAQSPEPGPMPTVDPAVGADESAIGDAATTLPSESSGSSALVLLVVVAVVATLGAAGFLVRRKATNPY